MSTHIATWLGDEPFDALAGGIARLADGTTLSLWGTLGCYQAWLDGVEYEPGEPEHTCVVEFFTDAYLERLAN